MDLHDELVTALAGRYEIERELGHGGMAIVYLARDVKNHRKVALKVMRPELADALGGERFLQEIAIAAPLVHPNIISLYDSGDAGGILYYTMAYVDGETLRQRLEREVQLPIEDALAIARQVASALDYAHSHGSVHRDIKPENILLQDDHVFVSDFGLARAVTRSASTPLTAPGIVLGTVPYMSPEQGSPSGRVNAASDIYSLGCVMFEMIAGMPPFRGATAEVILSHHQLTPAPSLCEERPACPESVDTAVRRALAKSPADRYRTAGDFIAAMDASVISDSPVNRVSPRALRAGHDPSTPKSRVAFRSLLAATAVALIAATAFLWRARNVNTGRLDPNRIVVFPLQDEGHYTNSEAGEAVATYIGYALDETRPLKWLEAWDLVDTQDARLPRMGAQAARKLSRTAGAGYFIDGSIIRSQDSVTVVLRLHSVSGDSVVRLAGASGLDGAYLPSLGLRAVATLLPALLPPSRIIDLSALSDRKTLAIANFLQGEREYRRMQFSSALDHYAAAVRVDSAFAIAALKGAQTATWLSRPVTDTALLGVALRRRETLTPYQTLLANGLDAYLRGDSDRAATQLKLAVHMDPSVPEGWTLLGEVYARSLTSETPADSLARASLERARQVDPDFAPALLLLQEMALRDGDLARAQRLRHELGRAGADTVHAVDRELMWQCVAKGPRAVNWTVSARRDASSTLDAGRVLARKASQPACARAALSAVFLDDSASLALRRGALLGLNGLLLSGSRTAELRKLFASQDAAGMPLWQFYLLNAAAGLGFEREADAVVDSLGRNYGRMPSPELWYVGSWIARMRDTAQLRQIEMTMKARVDSTRSRQDLLIANIMRARLSLAMGDTSAAISGLRALRTTGARRDIAWRPWEGLGVERLLLARLYLAQGHPEYALKVAEQLDATEPVPYLLYLRPSLELRLQAAQMLRNPRRESQYRERLNMLTVS